MIRSFGDSIYTCKINLVEAEEDQINLLNNIVEFNNKLDQYQNQGKDEKEILIKMHMLFVKVKN